MNSIIRVLFRSALVALASAAISLPVFGQPDPSRPAPPVGPGPTPPGASHGPGTPGGPPTLAPASPSGPGFAPNTPFPGAPGTMSAPTTALPKYLEGVVTLDEYQAFMKFQQQVNDDPASKELIAKIIALKQQAQQLQAELSKVRMKALTDNAPMKAIADKMQEAMRTQMSMPMTPPPGMPPTKTPASTMPAPKP